MTLRRKTLLIIGLTLAVLFGLLYFTLSAILLSGFSAVEEENTRTNVRRVLEAIDNETAELSATSGDWAFWDETYTFMAGENPGYPGVNLYNEVLTNLDINLILLTDPNGELVYAKTLDLQIDREIPLPAGLRDYLIKHPALLHPGSLDSLTAGLILIPEAPLLIAARPILTSARTGPIAGTLLMGRYLNEYRIDSLAEQTQYALTVHRVDRPPLPPDFETAFAALQESDEPFVRPLSETVIAGYAALPDIDDQPALLLRVETPRTVFAQGQRSLQYLIISLAGLGLSFIVLTLFLLERLVLARLAQLSAGVDRIGASGDLSRRLELPGQDELAGLAEDINHMLHALEESLAREKQLKSEIQALRIEIDQAQKQKRVAEIVESDFFVDLQTKAAAFRRRHQTRKQQDETPSEDQPAGSAA